MNDLLIALLVSLSFLDTVLTYHWAKACLAWQPKLKLKQVESNYFIIVCWNNFGLSMGSFVSGLVLLGVQYGLAAIHTNVYYIIVGILVFANLNHIRNFGILKKRLVAGSGNKRKSSNN